MSIRTNNTEPGKPSGCGYRVPILVAGLVVASLLVFYRPSKLFAQYYTLPPDAGIIDVTRAPFYAAGDGVTDDTEAILRALHTADAGGGRPRILYFPAGTYVVSRTLDWRADTGRWQCCLTLWGEHRDRTIIKLKDRTQGFTDPFSPRAVLYTASLVESGDPPEHQQMGEGNKAFFNSILNLTIDVGAGNPGAIGIDYLANNVGTIRNVTIRSSDPSKTGAIGVAMKRKYPGPALLYDLRIDGFDIGLSLDQLDHSITLKQVSLTNQRVVGIRNSSQVLGIYDLTSHNSVAVIENTNSLGLVSLVKGSFTGGSDLEAAILNEGGLYDRNLSVDGYRTSIVNHAGHGQGTDVRYVGSYASHDAVTLFESPAYPYHLPVQEAPDFYTTDFNRWASVVDFGARANDYKDDTRAVQAAIDSGAEIIYFPNGQYHLSRTIEVRANVRKILGLTSFITKTGSYFDDDSVLRPVIRIVNGSNDFVVIESFWFSGFRNAALIEHATPRTVVVRDCQLAAAIGIQNTRGAGNLFIENVAGLVGLFYPQRVWAWQLNPEGGNKITGAAVLNQGADLWVMGLKTERTSVVVKTMDEGTTEVYGGMVYPTGQAPPVPAFVNHGSSVLLSYAVTAYNPNGNYTVQIEEFRNGQTDQLLKNDVPSRGMSYGSLVPFYIGQ